MQTHTVTCLTLGESQTFGQIHAIWEATVGRVPAYHLPLEKFTTLLDPPLSRVFIVTIQGEARGFAITYLLRNGAASNQANQHLKGSLAVLAVAPNFQGQGIGSALHDVALQHLETAVRDSLSLSSPTASKSQIQLGTIFPRIFPGLPEGPEFEHAYRWFKNRGWPLVDEPSIDLYQPLSADYEVVERIRQKPASLGIRFGVPQAEDDEGLYALQNSEFGTFTVCHVSAEMVTVTDHQGWPDLFPALIQAGLREDIWCAFDSNDKIIGATIAAMPPATDEKSPVHRMLAWPCTIGKLHSTP
jgi:beta-N-acetylhexosaminidase